MRFLIKFSYDGSNYNGFQRQPNKRTIQKELEDVLTKINNKKTDIVCTGRTDKGVHAKCQYGHVDIDVDINEYKLKRAMNSYLPDDIHVINVKKVKDDFHARYNVISKEYKYYINMGEYNPIDRNYIFQYNYKLNIDKIKEGLKYLVGKHDFRSFVTENKVKENCIRTIEKAYITKKNNILCITFKGDGFLRYQVRNMVGSLIQVGEEKKDPKHIKELLDRKDRSKDGKTAPAVGLYLTKVSYK